MGNQIVRRWVVLLLVGSGISILGAQSNERIDELLAQDLAEAGHVNYLVLSAAGLIQDDATPAEAVEAATAEGYLPESMGPEDTLSFGEYSYLLMNAFNIPGGVMYRIIPGPRYAAREVVYQGWSRARRSPRVSISGDTAVRILSIYLNEEAGQ